MDRGGNPFTTLTLLHIESSIRNNFEHYTAKAPDSGPFIP